MASRGTSYIRRVYVESEKGLSMDEMDFSLDFYVYTSRKLHLDKRDLIHVQKDGESMYFAVIDSKVLGPGYVKCKLTVIDEELRFKSGKRQVSITRMTGIMIGVNCSCSDENYECDCFEEGYKIRFEPYHDIPLQDGVNIKYGIITEPITGYDKITEDMVKRFDFGLELKNHVFTFNRGDKVVILVNEDLDVKAYKDSGFGDLMQFNTSVCGANGEYSVVVDGVHYRVYGEMMLVNGEIKVTVR